MGFGNKDISATGIPFIIDGGGEVIETGEKGHVFAPYSGIIESIEMVADQSGSIVVDIWKCTYANIPPTVSDSITASDKPTLSSEQKSRNTTLTGWTKQVTKGDCIAFNVDSADTLTRVTISINIKR